MRSSNARRRALSRLAIIVMMALVVVFLVSVAPVGGASKKKIVCKDKCYKLEKVTDEEDVPVTTCVRTCLLRGQYKWKITTRYYDYGHYEQWCDDNEYCPNSGCMKVGEYDKRENNPGFWKKCTKTVIEYDWLPKNAPSPCST